MAGQKVFPEAVKMAVPMVYYLVVLLVDLTVPKRVDSLEVMKVDISVV